MSPPQNDTVFDLDVAYRPDGDIVILAARAGGVDRSIDLGKTWSKLWKAGFATSVAVVEDDPESDLIVAGVDTGVIRSDDWGATWQFRAFDGCRSFVTCLSATSSTNGSSHVVAGTVEDGIYRSIDGGVTWLPSSAGAYIPRISTVEMCEHHLWLAGTDGGLFTSVNQGLTWSGDIAADIDTDVTAVASSHNFLVLGSASVGLLIYHREQKVWSPLAGSRSDEETIALSLVELGPYRGELRVVTRGHAQRFRFEQNNYALNVEAFDETALHSPAVCGAIFMSKSEPYAVMADVVGTMRVIQCPTFDNPVEH